MSDGEGKMRYQIVTVFFDNASFVLKGAIEDRKDTEILVRILPEQDMSTIEECGVDVMVHIPDDIKGVEIYSGAVTRIVDREIRIGKLRLVETIQRRQDVKYIYPTPVRNVDLYKDGDTLQEVIGKGDVLDLSAGGIALTSEEEFQSGKKFWIKLSCAERVLDLRLVVLRGTEKNRDGKYTYGCRFEDLQSGTEAFIRRYVFRELRKHYL